MRKVGAVRAALANVVSPGLGYVYLSRLPFAVAYGLVAFSLIALAGWSGLVLTTGGLYTVAAALLVVACFPIVHCAVIALRHPDMTSRRYNRWWFYLLWVAAGWLLSDVVLSQRAAWFGYEPFRLPANSMAPTLERGDFVMTDTRYFQRNEPAYGDIAVFRFPRNEDVFYVKRVVGLPGDIIEIRNDVLYRNGEPVDEPYILLATFGRNSNSGSFAVPEDSYFLLGDNRHNSMDSRYIGAIPARLLHGRVEHRWFAFQGGAGIRWGRFPERFTEPAR